MYAYVRTYAVNVQAPGPEYAEAMRARRCDAEHGHGGSIGGAAWSVVHYAPLRLALSVVECLSSTVSSLVTRPTIHDPTEHFLGLSPVSQSAFGFAHSVSRLSRVQLQAGAACLSLLLFIQYGMK
jgi:hypothetical protein|uniref:Uncharacterized protein n=1 Tax=Haptolina ericina TaxID=156174 RepID=A0A7S3BVB8_9EUKA|mmetsp:Transcript_67762/g.151298  ORF Transcript_67762/g.151298 Transcript_67762/m.151298 type:complete len:125 (+) Transcript_67762:791-1165(+)